jgi:AGZA family xanthine/uracil permease-like MFS transporter
VEPVSHRPVMEPMFATSPAASRRWMPQERGGHEEPTCLAAAAANFPVALASGLGLNAVVTYALILGLTWQQAMAVVVVEDVIMTVLVLTKLREIALNAISLSLKFAIAVAIGLFIAFIGPKNAGIVVADPVTCLKLGDFTQEPVLLAVFGLVLTRARRPGRSGWDRHRHLAHQPGWNDLRGDPLFLFRSFLDLRHLHDRRRDLGGAGVLRLTLVPVIFALFMTAFFDTMGTVIAIGQEAKLLDEEGRLPDAERILLVDALSAGGGGAMGASSVTSYIESGSGVA